MAGANAKRIASQNSQTMKQLRLGFFVSFTIYFLHLFLFRSGRTWWRLFVFVLTEGLGVVLWQQLVTMGKKGDDLNAEGLTAYMFDVVYVTWFVHVGAALITTKFWYLYLSIPAYGAYRLFNFALPFIWPSSSSGAPPPAAGGRKNVAQQEKEEPAALSKRQEKLKKRNEKGPVRISQGGK